MQGARLPLVFPRLSFWKYVCYHVSFSARARARNKVCRVLGFLLCFRGSLFGSTCANTLLSLLGLGLGTKCAGCSASSCVSEALFLEVRVLTRFFLC